MPERSSLIEKELAQAASIREATAFTASQLAAFNIDLAMKQENWRLDLAKDFPHHYFMFGDAVDSRNASNCMEVLGVWSRTDPGCDIEIVFNSPGGHVMPGMALFDYIRGLGLNGHKVTTSVLGCAASMAGIIVQAGSWRTVGRESYMLIHELSSQAVGKISDLEDLTSFVRKIQDRVVRVFLDRSGGKITEPEFREKWARRDWWLDSEELLRYGFVDEIR